VLERVDEGRRRRNETQPVLPSAFVQPDHINKDSATQGC
jgi:hypothetical protein